MENKKFLIFVVFIFAAVLCSYFASAAAATATLIAPTANSNQSTILSVANCTTDMTNATSARIWYNSSTVANTSLTTIANDTPISDTIFNSSAVSIAALTDSAGDYWFWCSVTNISGSQVNSSWAKGITIDNTDPSITIDLPAAGWKRGTVTIYANMSDATSNFTNTTWYWFQNVSDDENYSLTPMAASCSYTGATSGFNCTGSLNISSTLLDGNYTLWVNASDDIWIAGSSDSHNNGTQKVLLIGSDNTPPLPVITCSPSTVQTGDNFPCTCSGSDATSGIANSSGSSSSPDGTSTPSSTGVFTYTCTTTDLLALTATSTATYYVTQPPAANPGSSGTPAPVTYTVNDAAFEQGYTMQMPANSRLKVQVDSQDHYVKVISISAEKATIEVSSNPVQVSLAPGENATVDVNGDGFYDVYILLDSILGSKASVTIQKIHQEIPSGQGAVAAPGIEPTAPEQATGSSLTWLWIVIAAVVVIALAWMISRSKKKK
jgi:hypothetical protein